MVWQFYLLKALCEQAIDARFGAMLLVIVFVLQAESSSGVKFAALD
jgi:hypothetical protein